MTQTELKLVLINGLFNFANVLSTSFVSVFIYTYTQSLVMMSIYTIIRIGLFPFFFTIGGKIVRKLPYSVTIASGLTLLAVMMVYILLAQDLFVQNSAFVYIAAVFYGMGEGLYWFSINNSNQIAPLPEHRASYLADIGIFNNVTSIVAPLVSSFILSLVAGMGGYYIIFALVIIFYVVITIISLTLRFKSQDSRDFKVVKHLFVSKKDVTWLMVQVATFAYGFQNSLSLTLTNILIYNAIGGSDTLYSNLLVVFAIVAIGSFYFIRRKMNDDTLFRYFKIGLFFIVTSCLVLVYLDNIFGAIYFGLTNAIASALYGNPYSYVMLNGIARYDKSENIAGRVIAKETALSIGRCLGMGTIILAYHLVGEPYYMMIAVTICSMAPFLCYAVVRRYYVPRTKEADTVIKDSAS